MKKKPHGHYCRICQQYKSNEKFSGRGHAAHICKACAKRENKPPDIKAESLIFIEDDYINGFGFEYSDFLFLNAIEEEPPKAKKKRKPSKEKLLRAAQKKKAKEFLNKILANGEIDVKDIQAAATKAGISTEALRRAKGSLSIRSFVTEDGSVWRLPQRNKQAETTTDSTNGGT